MSRKPARLPIADNMIFCCTANAGEPMPLPVTEKITSAEGRPELHVYTRDARCWIDLRAALFGEVQRLAALVAQTEETFAAQVPYRDSSLRVVVCPGHVFAERIAQVRRSAADNAVVMLH